MDTCRNAQTGEHPERIEGGKGEKEVGDQEESSDQIREGQPQWESYNQRKKKQPGMDIKQDELEVRVESETLLEEVEYTDKIEEDPYLKGPSWTHLQHLPTPAPHFSISTNLLARDGSRPQEADVFMRRRCRE